MGNKLAKTTQVSASEYYLHDLPSSYNLVLMEVLGRGRFFKSILCKHDEGLVIVKVYFKRGDPLDLKEYERRLAEIREVFRGVQHSHLWPFQFWLETDKAAYLLRQHFHNNLHDRLSTRPFLSLIEKKWLAFQLLCAVKQCHENGVCHGDIKCENVLVTSWNWIYLADFASFKPTYIPDDDPSDFSFFFDTGGRRRCYLAPERFFEHGCEIQVPHDASLKPSMDIFSLGCVIAELFLEGQPLFELSQLLAYRRGQYDPCQYLEKIPDSGIRKMILHMIQLDPNSRPSCESYLQEYGSAVFPSYFNPFLHKFFSCLIPVDSDTRVAVATGAFQEIHKQIINSRPYKDIILDNPASNNEFSEQTDPAEQIVSVSDGRVGDTHETLTGMNSTQNQLVGEISSLLKNVEQREPTKPMPENAITLTRNGTVTDDIKHSKHEVPSHQMPMLLMGYKKKGDYLLKKIEKNDLSSFMDRYNSELDTLLSSIFPSSRSNFRCEGMILIASLICSCLRTVKQPQLRRGALLMLMYSSLYIDDEDLLQHVIPYIIVMLSDSAAIVRCAALEALCNILPLIQDFPPSDAKIFPVYILPMLSTLPDDPEESVRICYASNIFKIALTAYRFQCCSSKDLDKKNFSLRTPSVINESTINKQIMSTDAELMELRKSVAEIVQELVMGSKNTPNIRRALLQDIGHLCCFFGKRQSNDFLLPILPAFLNDRDEQLRADFYAQIVFVCFFVGQRSVEEYLLPYIEQALSDEMEVVLVNALECLTMLCKSRFLGKKVLLDMIERAFPLLCYPISWVRKAAVSFIAASSESLGPVDSNIYLYPVLRPFLQRRPSSLSSDRALLSCLKPPISKLVFYQALENARSSDMLERQRKIWYNSAPSNQWVTIGHPSINQHTKEPVPQGSKYANSSMNNAIFAAEDAGKSRIPGTTLWNVSSTLDERSPLSSEKMHFSGFISSHVSSGNSLLHDRPSSGIPVYSFSMGRRGMRNAISSSDASLQWNSMGVGSLSTPSLDQVSKSFVSSSDHPKLISGSIFNISNAPKQAPTPLRELENHDEDQSSSITSKFLNVSVADTLKASSSINIDDNTPQSDLTGSASPVKASCAPDAGWKPRGVLVAHLQEHRAAVNDIAISNDNTFFVSASDDSSVKLWDTRKLEKDISFRSRLTYHLDGTRALCTTMLSSSAQVVVGASDGLIHLFSVDCISRGLDNVVERYSGIADVKKKQVGEGAILSLLNCSTGDGSTGKTVLYSTQLCGLHLWDTRQDSAAWKFKAAPLEGSISSLAIGSCGNWFISGTTRGVLTLWDMRFLLPVNSWQYSRACPIEKICLFTPPANSAVSSLGRPLVYVAAGCNEVSLWNAENGSCHQVFKVAGCEGDADIQSKIPWALASALSKSSSKHSIKRSSIPKYRTDELTEPPPRLPGVRCLLPLPGGDLLAGGTDLKIHYFNHSSPGSSFCVSGPTTKGVVPEDRYDTRSAFGVQVVQETSKRPAASRLTQKAVLAVAATDSAGSHCDSILSLASVRLNQRLLISSSRDGAIKVWK